mgnify:CR=1 FL=1
MRATPHEREFKHGWVDRFFRDRSRALDTSQDFPSDTVKSTDRVGIGAFEIGFEDALLALESFGIRRIQSAIPRHGEGNSPASDGYRAGPNGLAIMQEAECRLAMTEVDQDTAAFKFK